MTTREGSEEKSEVQPPGYFIRQELEARNWTPHDLAFMLETHEQDVNLLLSGKLGISPEMAKALGEAFGVPPDFFANLQKAYDLTNEPRARPAFLDRYLFAICSLLLALSQCPMTKRPASKVK